jgi:hypothetical protein
MIALMVSALLVGWVGSSWAQEPTAVQGTVRQVSADQHQITVADTDGKNVICQVNEDAAIFSPDEANAKLADLKPGEHVALLILKKGGQAQAGAILRRQGDFKDAELTGGTITKVGADNKQFTVTDATGRPMTYQMSDNAKVTLNNKEGKLADLKPNDRVAIVRVREGLGRGFAVKALAKCSEQGT